MAIMMSPRTNRSGLCKGINLICFDLLMCLMSVASVVMVCLTNPVTTIQIVFVIMVSIMTWLTFLRNLGSDHGRNKMLTIQEIITFSTFICVIMWMIPISVFWSYIPLFIGTFISYIIMCDGKDCIYDTFGETVGSLLVQAALFFMIGFINMNLTCCS